MGYNRIFFILFTFFCFGLGIVTPAQAGKLSGRGIFKIFKKNPLPPSVGVKVPQYIPVVFPYRGGVAVPAIVPIPVPEVLPVVQTPAAPARVSFPKEKVTSSLLEQVNISTETGVMLPAYPVVFPGKKQLDAVIFDLDGTLLDSLGAWEQAGPNYLRSQGILPEEGLVEEITSLSLLDGARLVKEKYHLPQTPEEILQATIAPVKQQYYTNIMPKPGVITLLKSLKSQGIKLCVATASDRKLAMAALQRTGLWEYFDFVLTCDEVGVGKRSPRVYEWALDRLETEKSRTLVVEDALYALETAKRAGFPTAGVADLHHPLEQVLQLRRTADYFFRSYLDILNP